MTPIDAGRCLARLMAAFPQPTWTPERTTLYASELGRWSSGAGERAVIELVRGADRCPSVAQLVESCRQHTQPGNALGRGHCALCEDGWVMADPDGRTVVAVCPNGCKPNAVAADARHRPPRVGGELDRNRERLADLTAIVKGATRMPTVRPSKPVKSHKYRVDLETGIAETTA